MTSLVTRNLSTIFSCQVSLSISLSLLPKWSNCISFPFGRSRAVWVGINTIPLPSLQIVKHFIQVGFSWSDSLGVTEYRIREGQSDRPSLGRQRPYRADSIDLAHSMSFIMAVASSSGWVRAILTLLLLVVCLISNDTSPLPSPLHTEFWKITPISSSVEVAFDSSSLLFSGPLKGQALCLLYLVCNL